MSELSIYPTSSKTAPCDPLVLRDNTTHRLVLELMLVDNPNDRSACVNGRLVAMRKGPNDQWPSLKDLDLAKLRRGEWTEIPLKAAELLLIQHRLSDLQRFHRNHGIPNLVTRLVPVSITDGTISPDLLERVASAHPEVLARLVSNLNDETSEYVRAAAGMQRLKNLYNVWLANQNNASEEFWQRTFTEHSFALTQLFPFPTVVIDGKAYVGGKNVHNRGGNIVDFLLASEVTRNAALVEIKTPVTPLLGRSYRSVFTPSDELVGTLQQVLNYKFTFTQEAPTLASDLDVAVFDPKCLVIVGNAGAELKTPQQRRAFELFRSNSRDVTIVTYDDVFAKLQSFILTVEPNNTELRQAA